MTGRVVFDGDVSGDVSGNVSTANMAPGVYVLRLIEGEGVRTQKVVIE
ncbi:MAG: T9SS type A sorting domain-containing protein [Bacteroidales bacterium]|nr:T9SS type A sorting domain-containing protein [Bacteroidales bacterium]